MIYGESDEARREALHGVLSTFFRHEADPLTLPESLLLHRTQDVELIFQC